MRATLRPLLLLPLLAGCGQEPLAPGRYTLQGRWEGRAFPYELALDLRQDRENRVTGSGELRALREVLRLDTLELDPLRVDTARDTVYADTLALSVSGQWSFPQVTLGLTAPGFAAATYEAAFVNQAGTPLPDSVAGRLEGSGFANVELRIGRLP